MKDNYKIVQNFLNSITVFQFFPLWDSWGPGTFLPGPRKHEVRNSAPAFIFDIFKIIDIRNSRTAENL